MTDPVKEVKKDDKKKSALGKIKDAILPDQEEQAAITVSYTHLTLPTSDLV